MNADCAEDASLLINWVIDLARATIAFFPTCAPSGATEGAAAHTHLFCSSAACLSVLSLTVLRVHTWNQKLGSIPRSYSLAIGQESLGDLVRL